MLLAAASVIPIVTQAQTSSFGSGKAVGVTVQGITSFESIAEVAAVGLHFTSIRASGPDFDFGIATLPTAVVGGALFLAPDVGIGHTFPIGGGAVMLKAGPSAVLLATGMGGGAWWGLHGGAIAFLRLARNFGIRVEVVPRVYAVDGEQLSGATFGIGLTSLPSLAKSRASSGRDRPVF
jgi:hypothetical protein